MKGSELRRGGRGSRSFEEVYQEAFKEAFESDLW